MDSVTQRLRETEQRAMARGDANLAAEARREMAKRGITSVETTIEPPAPSGIEIVNQPIDDEDEVETVDDPDLEPEPDLDLPPEPPLETTTQTSPLETVTPPRPKGRPKKNK